MAITVGRLVTFWNTYNQLDPAAKAQISEPYLCDDFGRANPYGWREEYANLWTIGTGARSEAWPSGLTSRPAQGTEIPGDTQEHLRDRLARYTAMADERYDAVVSGTS